MTAIANEDFQFSVTQTGAAFPGISGGDKSKVDAVTSDKLVLADKKAILEEVKKSDVSSAWGCLGPLGKTGAGTSTFITKGSFSIPAGSMKCKADGKSVVLKGDFAICSCIGQDTPSAPPNTPVPFTGSCRIEISDAGQNKVKGK